MNKPQIITFGCRLNSYESEVMRRHAEQANVENLVLVNSCAVTNEAVRQMRQNIRRLRRENADARIVVTGCAAQIEAEHIGEMAEVDHVIGNHEKLQAETFIALADKTLPRIAVQDIQQVKKADGAQIARFHGRARAYVQVQNGCDHRCTFCIIPYGRGVSRSLPAVEVIEQVKTLVGEGFAEIVLTGVDITAYGEDLDTPMPLGRLVKQILHEVTELPRLRISSIDALESDPELLEILASSSRLMPHLHLSLQAGDDMILKRMKRRHSVRDAVEFCRALREARPDMTLGADMIAGFPTETEAMHENSLAHIEACGISRLHIFPFSARPGTPAARMPQVNGKIIKQRAAALREMGRQMNQRHLQSQVGAQLELLVEQPHIGRSPQFTEMRLETEASPGEMVQAYVTGIADDMLTGRIVS